MSKTRKILVPIVLILGAIQFIPHQHPQATTTEGERFTTDVAEVRNLLDVACMDCHSDQTRYPWYAEVTPINFWLDHHIEEGREHLNFSEWNSLSMADRRHAIKETIEVLEKKEMPLWTYWIVHWDAKLTDAERSILLDYFKNYKVEASATATASDGKTDTDEDDVDDELNDEGVSSMEEAHEH
ncbi:MAG: cytochrome C [Flavobacteriales bacterium]|nr:cytochrome C [Flavobacteriales bacterium]